MLIELNREITERLSKTELEIVRYINEHEQVFSERSIVDIAFETFSSPATVSRAIKKCNIDGFSELRFRSIQKENQKPLNQASEVLYQSLHEVQAVVEGISPVKLIKASEMIRKAERIYVLGRGLSEYVAEEFSMKLQLLGYNSMFIRDPNIMLRKTQSVHREDLLINFSLNGETKEIIDSSVNARNNGTGIVTVCCSGDSPLIELSDVALVGYSDPVSAIEQYEVRSRLPLHVLSRILTEYLATDI